jgi:hypothetical protein
MMLASPADVLGTLTDDELQKWAGKALLKKAAKLLAGQLQAEIETEPALVIRFPARNITCRWVPGGGVAGMVCSCKSQNVCEHVVAAVLAYQAFLGRREFAATQTVLEESSGAPRTRAEVLASVGSVLREMISLGLARLSDATADRLTTLAVSAHGVDLPRLERTLKSLADEVRLALRRDAQSSTAAMLTQAARAHALRTALERGLTPALVGQHRTQYHDVGQLTLVGVGAQHWRSKGGYHGVTVYFWDESRSGWSTWSESRPVQQSAFDPVGRFRSDGPWPGCPSPQEASRSVLRLSSAFRNPQGRLSGREATRAHVLGPSRPRDLPGIVRDWSELVPKARELFGGGLGDHTENRDLVLLAPQLWGPPLYDDLRQELTRPVLDGQGRVLPLVLPYTQENQEAVSLLEQHTPAEDDAILGALRLVAGRLCIHPISVFHEDRIIHLNLETAAGAVTSDSRALAASPSEEEPLADAGNEAAASTGSATPLGRLLITAQAELEALAEGGIAVRRDLGLLTGAAQRMETLGLLTCARPLARLADALVSTARLADPECRRQSAAALLGAYYVLQLAADQETIAVACAGLGVG